MVNAPDITVLIKAPNQKHADYPVRCQLSWTVHQLKNHLSESYPSKPSVREQRLIYSGQLLADASRLQEVLRQHDDQSTVHTVHLVCLPPAEPVPPAAPATGLRQRRPHQPQAAAPAPPPAAADPAAMAAPPMAAPLRQQYDLTQWAHMLQNNQHQLVAMQQMYSQYWVQYAQMMQVNPAGLPMIWPQPVQVPSQPAAAAAAAAAPAAAAEGQPQQPPPQPAQPQNVHLNAQGGVLAEEEEGGAQWDWLDWLHGLARLSVLFLAVYLYASVSRLVVVLFFGFIAYLYNQGWFQDGRARAPPAAAPAPAPEQQQQQQQQEEAPAEAGEESDQEAEPEQQDGPDVRRTLEQVLDEMGVAPPVAAERPHPLTLAWTFFSSFFASLIPDRIEQ